MGPSPIWGHLDDRERLLIALPSLSQLHQLKLFSLATQTGSLSVLSQIALLRELFVSTHNLVPQSFMALTQIEHLGFQHEGRATVEIALPSGNWVMLHSLMLFTRCSVSHLEAASQLQSIELAMLQYVIGMRWPSQLPNIKTIWSNVLCAGDIEPLSALPAAWLNYTNLTSLHIPSVSASDLPTWLSALQKLQMLEMYHSRFNVFPTVLAQLSGIGELHLYGMHAPMTPDVLGLANLPFLTYLDFGVMIDEEEYDPDLDWHNEKLLDRHEVEVLQKLQLALESRPVPLVMSTDWAHLSYRVADEGVPKW